MSESLAEQQEQLKHLKDLGSKLEIPPVSKDSLIKLFKQAVKILSNLDQSPPALILESMQPFLKAIVKPELLKHQDKDVKLLVASCLCEITRITAPEAPYSDDILKDVFGLIVGTFGGLNETSGPSFGRRVIILETLARYRSCVVMLDLECDDLVYELFRTFLAVARDDHPENVLSAMKTIMLVLLEESEDIHADILYILFSALGRNKKDITEAARKLAMNVIERCATKLEPAVKQLLISSMSEDSSCYKIDYHEVIYDLYCCSPQILSGCVPYLTGELLNDQSEARLRAINRVGELFAIPGTVISEAFQPIFIEFLKRLTDRVVDVRMTALDYVKRCLLSNPLRPEAAQIFGALCDRLLDYDENVRKQVVAVVCDIACYNLSSVPVETTKLVAERLRDKSLLVKKYTLDRLSEIYRLYCLKCKEGWANIYDWVPGKILRCFYDKDFRSDAIESILCGSLFPVEFAVKDIVEHWIRILPVLDKIEVKALEKILEQKQRLQQEMQKYLSLKQAYKESDMADYQRKAALLFRVMSRFFTDPAKAEEEFISLDQLKDANIWKNLFALLDPCTSFHDAHVIQEDLLKILGEKHRLLDFLNVLSLKCSYLLFSKEHVKDILSELEVQKSAGNIECCLSCCNMLVILASYSPLLLIGSEENLLNLLKDGSEIVKEGILHVIARAGGSIREQLVSLSSSVDLILERLCLEGTRRQAKYAVHALAAITKDDGLRSLSVLCKRLVDIMEKKAHLPTVLQSLGCIAQTAMAVYETRESEIVGFINSKILQLSNKGQEKLKARWRDPSELCQLKVFGIKTLVKSYLPVKDAHLRSGIDTLIGILRNMLSFGEVSRELESSSVDKAHLKLASAKAVLRLSRYWENKIPVDVFHLALRTVETNYRQARKIFLNKVHQYIKDRVLDAKYACAFLLDIFVSKQAEVDEDKHNLGDVIHMCHQMKARQLSLHSDGNSQLPYPEHLLPYLVHTLAHHPKCPNFDQCRDAKAFETLYRVLYVFFSMVVRGGEDLSSTNNADKKEEITPDVISILQCIKRSEDSMDPLKSKNSHGIAELGLLVMKRLAQKAGDCEGATACISLPSTLYKPSDLKDENNAQVTGLLTWLDDDSVLVHFESHVLDVNGTVHAEIPQDEILEDIETEGKEMPLGKLIKRIKSQKNKSKTVTGNSTSAEKKNDVDVLKVVRDINLDCMELPSKIEPSNGHHKQLIGKMKYEEGNLNKKRKAGCAGATPIPKRKRSLSARSVSKHSSGSASKASTIAGLRNPLQAMNVPSQLDFVSPSKKKRGGKTSKQRDENEGHEADTKANYAEPDKNYSTSNDNSSVGLKKRKSRSVLGLEKCTSKESGDHTADLVDCRIKVWWPLDKRFYPGVVKSYDPEKKKHVVLYDDGDVEVLNLGKERWEFVDDGHRLKKNTNGIKSSKITSPKERHKLSDGSVQKGSGKRQSRAKGKGVQNKNLKRVKKGVVKGKNATASEKVETNFNISHVEAAASSDADKLKSGHLKEGMDEVPQNLACDVEDKSDIAGQGGDGGPAGTDSEDFGKEADLSPKSSQDGGEANSQQDPHDSDIEEPDDVDKSIEKPVGSSQKECIENAKIKCDGQHITENVDASCAGNAEDAEDEPLSVWKRRVEKSCQAK